MSDPLKPGALLTRGRHMFFTTVESEPRIKSSVDEHDDSFARDTTVDELKEVRLNPFQTV